SSGGLIPGFYFWSGNDWNSVSNGTTGGTGSGGDNWSLTGNTINGDKFLGTANYTSLKFKVNNSQFALFHPNGGMAIGFGASATANRSIAFGDNANSNQGQDAVTIGTNSQAKNNESVAIGYGAQSNFRNVAIGKDAKANANDAVVLGSN